MKILSLHVPILFCFNLYADARKLTEFKSLSINDLDYDTNLLGKYHNDIFVGLMGMYDKPDPLSLSLEENLKQVMIEHCPSNDMQLLTSCITSVLDHMGSKSSLSPEDYNRARSVLSDDAMNRLEQVMTKNRKREVLKEIKLLKEGFDENNLEGKAALTALNFAEQSYVFWSDMAKKDNRRLQQSFLSSLQNFITFVTTPGFIADFVANSVTLIAGTLLTGGDITAAILSVINTFTEIVTTGTAAPSDAPTPAGGTTAPTSTTTTTTGPVATPVTSAPTPLQILTPTSAPVVITTAPTANVTAAPVPTASVAPTASNVTTAPTASNVTTAPTASNVTTAPTASNVTTAPTASNVTTAPTASNVTEAPTASNVTASPTASNVTVAPDSPSVAPSDSPSAAPSDSSSDSPSAAPSDSPSVAPSDSSSDSPTEQPTMEPTGEPTMEPTMEPTEAGTDSPTNDD